MRAVDLIVKKRNGESLDREEIGFLVDGFTCGEVPDYQIASFLMAVYFRGMTGEETGRLTQAMIASGDLMDLSSVKGPLIDKHSTGGVGDKVSLVLAPIAASCGISVPMMSGRSLGHTGGTLDKLESIPGYTTQLSHGRFLECLREVGFAMIGQSESIVPADKALYALRDVTGTVESIPLITASILSKKFAEGARGLVFDVKTGSGAFMKNIERARELAESLVESGRRLGRKVWAVISDMDQPLGRMVGNFLEVRETIDCLKGRGPDDLMDLTIRLAARMLVLGDRYAGVGEAERACRNTIEDGSAWRTFLRSVEHQGGDVDVVLNPERGPRAQHVVPLTLPESGFIERIDAYRVGLAATVLGAGRSKQSDSVLPGVGVELKRVRGDAVRSGDEVCAMHADSEESIRDAAALLESAYTLSDRPPRTKSRIIEELG